MSDDIEIAPRKEAGITRISARTGAILALFSIAFTALMALTYETTKDRLAENAREEKRKLIDEVLPRADYDNDLLADTITLPATPALGLEAETVMYRARKAGVPAALIVEAAAPDGYSGRIGLLLAVRADGTLAALRVISHKETPGLGDYIDPQKDKNKARPWVKQFDQQNLANLGESRWRVKKDGGQFEYMAGATISPRAVVNASRRALQWVTPRQAGLFALPPGQKFEDKP